MIICTLVRKMYSYSYLYIPLRLLIVSEPAFSSSRPSQCIGLSTVVISKTILILLIPPMNLVEMQMLTTKSKVVYESLIFLQ